MHALDIQMDTQKWARSAEGQLFLRNFYGNLLNRKNVPIEDIQETEDAAEQLAYNFMVTLYRADTIFITSDMMHLILQAAHDLPDEAAVCDPHLFLGPFGYVQFEEAILGEDINGVQMVVGGFCWHEQEVARVHPERTDMQNCVALHMVVDPDDVRDGTNREFTPWLREHGFKIPPRVPCHMYPMEYGKDCTTFPDEKGAELTKGIVKFFIAMNLVAQQKIGKPRTVTPDRPTRKRAAKWDMNGERLITLITLRRENVKVERDPDAPPVEWSRRWIVGGHWKRQYYPSTDSHQWIYIYEYVKGPEDKPLIIRDRRIFDFRR